MADAPGQPKVGSPADRRRSVSGGIIDKRRKQKGGLTLDLANSEEAAGSKQKGFSISNAGVLEEGDISISKSGMSMSGKPPSALPQVVATPIPSALTPQSSVTADRPGLESPKDDIRIDDLEIVGEIGRGAGGVVQKVMYRPTGRLMAMKVIRLNVVETVRKQIILELRTLYQSQSPNIVKFYGAFFTEGQIQICLELMDGGSLEALVARVGAFPEVVVGCIAGQVLRGLVYLHKDRHLLHRDLKPSNILINARGQVKISDFGVSGQLASSLASRGTWVGTVTYFSPERIQGKSYSVASDIWSFGVSMLELAMGHYPFFTKKPAPAEAAATAAAAAAAGTPVEPAAAAGGSDVGFWDLLSMVVDNDIPELDPATSSAEIRAFMTACLQKDPSKRPSPVELLNHPFIRTSESAAFDLAGWIRQSIPPENVDPTAPTSARSNVTTVGLAPASSLPSALSSLSVGSAGTAPSPSLSAATGADLAPAGDSSARIRAGSFNESARRSSIDGGTGEARTKKPSNERRASAFLRQLNPFKKDAPAV